MKHTVTHLFIGYIVQCEDLDSKDVFNVEVLINDKLQGAKLNAAIAEGAKKSHLVTLSGNSFEFELVCRSGRSVKKTITREETGKYTEQASNLLAEFNGSVVS